MTEAALKCEEATRGESIECWGCGRFARGCDARLPDTSFETMNRLGWGFAYGPDAGSEDGMGFWYACPEHKDPD